MPIARSPRVTPHNWYNKIIDLVVSKARYYWEKMFLPLQSPPPQKHLSLQVYYANAHTICILKIGTITLYNYSYIAHVA